MESDWGEGPNLNNKLFAAFAGLPWQPKGPDNFKMRNAFLFSFAERYFVTPVKCDRQAVKWSL